ncbi:hypothetical protein ACFFK0_11725 [Paenibacillus chartarius]|uniref:Uncharacterized protein n=1 Tax=Paenibacillus chartarius TaxID=747481 RepID=A0ABV6DKG1_9BACL
MGIAVSFKLLNQRGTLASYGYGKDFDNFDGVIEINLSKHVGDEITSENEQGIRFDVVTPCESEWKDYGLAGRVFVRILRHDKEHGSYPEKGGHFEG